MDGACRVVVRLIAVLMAVAGLAGCAPHTGASATPPGQSQTMAVYARRMVLQLHHDRALNVMLARAQIKAPIAALAVVTPQGFVQKGGVAQNVVPAAVAKALIAHLIDVNFGPFLPGMPDRPLIFEFPVTPPPADALTLPDAPGFVQKMLVLYQPNQVLVTRVGSPVPLAAYIKLLKGTMAALFGALPPERGVTASLVMGVKPGMKSRAWVVTGPNHLAPALVARLKAAAEAVPAVPVHGGPIAFAITFTVWGGGQPITDAKHPVPFPPSWYRGAPKGNVDVPDGVFARIWP